MALITLFSEKDLYAPYKLIIHFHSFIVITDCTHTHTLSLSHTHTLSLSLSLSLSHTHTHTQTNTYVCIYVCVFIYVCRPYVFVKKKKKKKIILYLMKFILSLSCNNRFSVCFFFSLLSATKEPLSISLFHIWFASVFEIRLCLMFCITWVFDVCLYPRRTCLQTGPLKKQQ